MEIIQTADVFKTLIENIKSSTPNYKDPLAFLNDDWIKLYQKQLK